MSYKTYTTEGLVCGSTHSNTSDRSYLIFTRDAGMIWASAKSVREERSKQRYALQDFSHIRVSLVKGKSGWRIGSVEPLGNAFMQAENRAQRGCVTYVFTQLRRYVHGEVPLEQVFGEALCAVQGLRGNEALYPTVQRLFTLRLLSSLGYVPVSSPLRAIIEAPSLEAAQVLYTDALQKDIDTAIEEAAQASHL